jgi:hypothetical protein
MGEMVLTRGLEARHTFPPGHGRLPAGEGWNLILALVPANSEFPHSQFHTHRYASADRFERPQRSANAPTEAPAQMEFPGSMP